ncbi:SDR family oxidoreductase [uncultured Thalassolituus sp.]|uniref:UDP-glucose 4-epimerase family protein n=1 Tax=uncultured Thalassolituus sp. TaxID=285273 RepID=UPI0026048B7E|nr:SDR family oxidoreductase [uncultured Thalassolituus sp.]
MSDSLRVVVTGASGFVGARLLSTLCNSGKFNVTSILRSRSSSHEKMLDEFTVESIGPQTSYGRLFDGVDSVVHLAARVHVMNEYSEDPLRDFREVNVFGTVNLARQAASAGVRRFIFISSVKVSGERTEQGRPFVEAMRANPEDAYGQSKFEAEEALKEIAKETGMEVVIIRPPLVYGPGVKANFRSLISLCNTGFPLPFGSIHNRRSLIYVDNLVDFILYCISHPAAANETFLVSDREDVSIAALISRIRKLQGRRSFLLPVPTSLFTFAGRLTGKTEVVSRLVSDLSVDSTKASQLLDWTPPYSLDRGLQNTVAHYLHEET